MRHINVFSFQQIITCADGRRCTITIEPGESTCQVFRDCGPKFPCIAAPTCTWDFFVEDNCAVYSCQPGPAPSPQSHSGLLISTGVIGSILVVLICLRCIKKRLRRHDYDAIHSAEDDPIIRERAEQHGGQHDYGAINSVENEFYEEDDPDSIEDSNPNSMRMSVLQKKVQPPEGEQQLPEGEQQESSC